jgi:hypothetical protein
MVSTAGALVKQIDGVFRDRAQGKSVAREEYHPHLDSLQDGVDFASILQILFSPLCSFPDSRTGRNFLGKKRVSHFPTASEWL